MDFDFSKGYTSAFYATILDPVTWDDVERLEIVSGSINRTNTDLRQSASLTLRNYPYDTDRYIRIYMVANQLGSYERVPLFTGIATSPGYTYNAGVRDVTVQCYSVLKPLQDILLRHGWYIKEGSNCLNELQDLLSYTRAPVAFSDYDPEELKKNELEDDIIAEDNESNLSMIELLLYAIDWVMWINGDGTIVLAPNQEDPNIDPASIFSPRNAVIETSFSVQHDMFDCPNCLRVTFNDYMAEAKDEDEDSPLSIQNRGREIWAVEDNVDLLKNETLAEYADKRLLELQDVSETISYDRRYLPEVNTDNKIVLAYPELSGEFIVESQNITLGHAAVVSEQIRRSM